MAHRGGLFEQKECFLLELTGEFLFDERKLVLCGKGSLLNTAGNI